MSFDGHERGGWLTTDEVRQGPDIEAREPPTRIRVGFAVAEDSIFPSLDAAFHLRVTQFPEGTMKLLLNFIEM